MKINYIIAMYLGTRRAYVDTTGFTFLQYQLNYLQSLDENSIISNVVFSINDDGFANREEVENIISSKGLKVKYQIKYRPNVGFSYGNWNETLAEYKDMGFDFHFINEDDYVPYVENWLDPFLKEFEDNVGFVCLKKSWEGFHGYRIHPTMSAGLISNEAVIKTQEIFNSILWVHPHSTQYGQAEESQLHMMDNLELCGFTWRGVSEDYSKPFVHATLGSIERSANPIYPPLLVPIEINIDNLPTALV
jgi:hypothetical protein